MDSRTEEIGFICASGLFDHDYYRAIYPPGSDDPGVDLKEYFDRGAAQGKKPNFYFDADWYLYNNPDVVEAGLHPLFHYARHGDIENRRPCLWFDTPWYRRRHNLPPDVGALAHYLAHRREGRYSPVPEFDVRLYLDSCADSAPTDGDPFVHYCETGFRDGLNPSAAFDTRLYQDRFLRGDRSRNPLLHMLFHRENLEYLRRTGLFDYDFYRRSYPDIASTGIDILAHFYHVGCAEGMKPNLYFDPDWYVAQNPDVAASGLQPFFHYARFGDREGRRPSLYFDPAWYRRRYSLSPDTCSLAHYLFHRHSCRYSTIPEFDAAYYAERSPGIAAAGLDPFEHYLLVGYREGLDPSPGFSTEAYQSLFRLFESEPNPLIRYLAHRDAPHLSSRLSTERPTIADEIRRFAAPGEYFEDFAAQLPGRPRAKVLAYYLSQFHAVPENDAWWGKGFTEWTNLARGVPRFVGQHQPRIPRDLGFYTLDSVEPMRRQIEMAKQAGIFGFVFYFYWFNRRRLLDAPIDRFLGEPSLDMPFCLMWANENWTRRWDGGESEILISQNYRIADDARLVAEFQRHFADPRYIRIAGRPLLMIYRPGMIPEPRTTVARWRELFRRRVGEEPLLVMAQSFGDRDPEHYGFDGAIEFPPHKLAENLPTINHEITYLDPRFAGSVYRYDDLAKASLEAEPPRYPLIRTLVPSWDNDARRQGHGVVVTGSTPAKYEQWLRALAVQAREQPFFGEPFVCVNAWNEWCEGAYLEPDVHFGAAYLNATARALAAETPVQSGRRLLLVAHDAEAHESQLNLLNLGRHLRRRGVECEFLLLGGGMLEAAFREVAPTRTVPAGAAPAGHLRALRERGFNRALATAQAAAAARDVLHEYRVATILLADEIAPETGQPAADATAAAIADAEAIIFPSTASRDRLRAAAGADAGPDRRISVITPGLYQNVVAGPEAAAAMRKELGIGAEAALIVGAGPGDLRKGFDLFLQLWRLLNRRRDRPVHLCWVGTVDRALGEGLAGEIAAASGAGTFHLVAPHTDISVFFGGADGFALTSRDEPYPVAALEALAAGLPVYAFDRTGEIPEILREPGIGTVVPYGNVPAMARAVASGLRKGRDPAGRERRRALIRTGFDFGAYADRVLAVAFPEPAAPDEERQSA